MSRVKKDENDMTKCWSVCRTTNTSQVRVLMVELFVNQFDIKGLNVHLLSDLVISSFGIFLRQVKKI